MFERERIIGYDAREPHPYVMRCCGLINPRARSVSSVDRDARRSVLPEDLKNSTYLQLWKSLAAVVKRLSEQEMQDAVIVAITVEPEYLTTAHFEQWNKIFPIRKPENKDFLLELKSSLEPQDLSPEWEFLGYDVADAWLFSALCNAGLGADAKIAGQWAGRINDQHLFNQEKDAVEFAHFAGSVLRTHCPFYIFGVYKI